MWDILDTKLYAILSNPLYKSSSDSEGELKDVYKEFMETFMGHRTKRILRVGRKVHQTY